VAGRTHLVPPFPCKKSNGLCFPATAAPSTTVPRLPSVPGTVLFDEKYWDGNV